MADLNRLNSLKESFNSIIDAMSKSKLKKSASSTTLPTGSATSTCSTSITSNVAPGPGPDIKPDVNVLSYSLSKSFSQSRLIRGGVPTRQKRTRKAKLKQKKIFTLLQSEVMHLNSIRRNLESRRTVFVDVGGDQTAGELLHAVREAFGLGKESAISLYRARRNNSLEEMVLDDMPKMIPSLKKSQIYVKATFPSQLRSLLTLKNENSPTVICNIPMTSSIETNTPKIEIVPPQRDSPHPTPQPLMIVRSTDVHEGTSTVSPQQNSPTVICNIPMTSSIETNTPKIEIVPPQRDSPHPTPQPLMIVRSTDVHEGTSTVSPQQGGHRNEYNNCYSSAVLSCLHSLPEFWELVQHFSLVGVVMGDLLLRALKATQRFHDCSSMNKDAVIEDCDISLAAVYSRIHWDDVKHRGTGLWNDAEEFFDCIIQTLMEDCYEATTESQMVQSMFMSTVDVFNTFPMENGETLFVNLNIGGKQTRLLIAWENGSTLYAGIMKMLQCHDSKGLPPYEHSAITSQPGILAVCIKKNDEQQGQMAVGISMPGMFLAGYPGHMLTNHTYWLRSAVLYDCNHYFNINRDPSTRNKWMVQNGVKVRQVGDDEAALLLAKHAYIVFYASSDMGSLTKASSHFQNCVTVASSVRSHCTLPPEMQKVGESLSVSDDSEETEKPKVSERKSLNFSDDSDFEKTENVSTKPKSKLPIRPSKLSRQKASVHKVLSFSDDSDFEETKRPPSKKLLDLDRPFEEILIELNKREADEILKERDGEELVGDELHLMNSLKSSVVVPRGNVKWSDIFGLEEVKEKLKENIIFPSLCPELYEQWGITPAKGILLYGPPGTGKTMLVKALAAEAEFPMFAVKPSDIVDKYIGNSAKNIKLLFKLARNKAPSIIFFDEIDALATVRTDRGNEERRSMMTQLLQEIDGFTSNEGHVVHVIGATNCPWDLDPAMKRRLPVHVYIPLPDDSSRRTLLSSGLNPGVDLMLLVKRTKGMSSSEITELCRETRRAKLGAIFKGKSIQEMKKVKKLPSCPQVTTRDVVKALGTISRAINSVTVKKYENFGKK